MSNQIYSHQLIQQKVEYTKEYLMIEMHKFYFLLDTMKDMKHLHDGMSGILYAFFNIDNRFTYDVEVITALHIISDKYDTIHYNLLKEKYQKEHKVVN